MPVMACSHWPSVSDANGDISSTARPCKAMFRVAATSHRHDHVTRRIHRLHAIHPRVITIKLARAIGIAFELNVPANCTACRAYRGGASALGFNSDSLGGRVLRLVCTASCTAVVVKGADST